MTLKEAVFFILKYTAFGLAAAFVILLLASAGDRAGFSFSPPFLFSRYSYNDAVAVTAPAVVNIYAGRVYPERLHPLFHDPLFRRFFQNPPGQPNNRPDNSIGSGVIMDSSGHILTNTHVIQNADYISVTLHDGREAEARLIGMDTDTDLAVLKIQLDHLPSILIGDSARLKVGDVVLAIGNPYDFGQTVTQGIVSATRRKRRGISYFDDFIQTDADINLGNSGGALINANGELVGINTAIISSSGGSEGIGLATPINQALDVMRQIIENGGVVRGWLGIEARTLGRDVPPAARRRGGVLITAIIRHGPAERAGLIPGDIILNIDGEAVLSPDQAIEMIAAMQPGSEAKIKILRGWDERELNARIAQRPRASLPR